MAVFACVGCEALFKRSQPTAENLQRLISANADEIEFKRFSFKADSGVGGMAFLFRFELSLESLEILRNEYQELQTFRSRSAELELEEKNLLLRANQITSEYDVPSWFTMPKGDRIVKLALKEERKQVFLYYAEDEKFVIGLGYSR